MFRSFRAGRRGHQLHSFSSGKRAAPVARRSLAAAVSPRPPVTLGGDHLARVEEEEEERRGWGRGGEKVAIVPGGV